MNQVEQSSPVYLILGASAGIGEATARHLAARSARVVLGARRRERCEAIAHQICVKGGEAVAVEVDVADEVQIAAAVQATVERFGRLDGAVNNAAALDPLGPVTELNADAVARLFRVNVLGVLVGMKYQIPALAHGGAIVNVASIVGHRTFPGTAAYTASKLAVVGLGRVAAAEAAKNGIRVNTVSPGPVVTNMAISAFGDEAAIHASATASHANRAGRPDDIADVIAWLLSDAARHVSGAEIIADGGYIL